MPALIVKLLKVATTEGARLTVMVYISVVIPSWAVTFVVMVLAPTTSAIAVEAEPEATVTPFTLMVEVASVTVGVTVIDEVEFVTLSV